jgi:hypothetical protein
MSLQRVGLSGKFDRFSKMIFFSRLEREITRKIGLFYQKFGIILKVSMGSDKKKKMFILLIVVVVGNAIK